MKLMRILPTAVFIIFIIMSFLATAEVLTTKEDAQNTLRTDKLNTKAILKTITYTTNEICTLNYDNEEVDVCEICFTVTDITGTLMERCIHTLENMTNTQVDALVQNYVKNEREQELRNTKYQYLKSTRINQTTNVI